MNISIHQQQWMAKISDSFITLKQFLLLLNNFGGTQLKIQWSCKQFFWKTQISWFQASIHVHQCIYKFCYLFWNAISFCHPIKNLPCVKTKIFFFSKKFSDRLSDIYCQLYFIFFVDLCFKNPGIRMRLIAWFRK